MQSYVYEVKTGSKKAGIFPVYNILTLEDSTTEWSYATHCMKEQQKNQSWPQKITI